MPIKTGLTRGESNNNPGNIDYNRNTKWQGLADPPIEQTAKRPRFARFTSPEWGIRALARTLITYQDQHDIGTVRGIINRWAPPNENNTHAYIQAVSQKLGVAPDDQIDVHTYETMRPLVEAIIKHENGRCIYTNAQIDEGLRRAGVLPPPKLAVQKTMFSPEGVGTGTAGIGTAGMMLTEQAQQLQLTAPEGSHTLQILCAVLTFVGVILTVYGLVKRVRSRSA